MAKRSGRLEIDFAKLLNGRKHVLRKGVHFRDYVNFRQRLYQTWHQVNDDDSRCLRTRMLGNSLIVQVVPKHVTRRCPRCGTAFVIAYNSKRKFCSLACINAYQSNKFIGRTARKAVLLWNKGHTQSEIARALGVSRQRVGQVLRMLATELVAPVGPRTARIEKDRTNDRSKVG